MGMAKICNNCACYEVCFYANANRTEDCTLWQPKMDWIPVSERLPKEYTKVLAIDRVTGKVDIAQINAFGCFVYADGRGHGASHWMPLPEPPEEE